LICQYAGQCLSLTIFLSCRLRGSCKTVPLPPAKTATPQKFEVALAYARLREEQQVVLELAVDRLPVSNLDGLSRELGLDNSIVSVLENWPGDGPAFLFIDALDATRGGQSEAVFRALIADVLYLPNQRWRVVASSRDYVALPNAILSDRRLSIEARGMICFILSKSKNFEIRPYALRHVLSTEGRRLGRTKLDRMIDEALSVGYMARSDKQTRKEGGKFGRYAYICGLPEDVGGVI
jgi:hypothetical protein